MTISSEQPDPEALPGKAGAEDPHVLLAGGRLGCCHRGLDSVRDEADPRVSGSGRRAVGKDVDAALESPAVDSPDAVPSLAGQVVPAFSSVTQLEA